MSRWTEQKTELREALRLPPSTSDTAILGTAFARAAAREIQRNSEFAGEVRREYEELTALHGRGAKRVSSKELMEPLVPIRYLDVRTLDPFTPPNPKELIYAYGADKLARALQEYTLDWLKQTAERIQQEYPGTKPKSRASKQTVIDYIVQYAGE